MKKILFFVIASVALLSLSCKNETATDPATESTTALASDKVSGLVKYEVTCSPGGFQLAYKDSTGTTVKKSISSGSWTTSFTGHQADSVSVSAQADNLNATITTKIYYKGNILGQGSASGDHSTAKAVGKL